MAEMADRSWLGGYRVAVFAVRHKREREGWARAKGWAKRVLSEWRDEVQRTGVPSRGTAGIIDGLLDSLGV